MTEHNKLVIFDLDGVLVDSRELHFTSLNAALESVDSKYIITRSEHLSTYDGLPTSTKLKMLTNSKNLPVSLHDIVWHRKQKATLDIINTFSVNHKLVDICKQIKEHNYKIAVASNSIRETVKSTLLRIGILDYVDYFQSNEDVKRPKPFPEIYWNCMTALNAIPSTTIIIEDSHIGRQGAINSGAKLLPVENTTDVTWDYIKIAIDNINNATPCRIPWCDSNLNVLIPMAGAGLRFATAGYSFPKPLIEIRSKPMIQVVVENLNIQANYIFVVQTLHYEKYNLKYLLNLIQPGCTIIQVDSITDGAACTTLMAEKYINNDNPLLIANSDQFIEWDSNEAMYAFGADGIDGGILIFKNKHPKWSYVSLNETGFVSDIAEKKVISDNATVGIYYWKKGSDYVKYAKQMINKDIRTNNEFYVCPVYNEAIADGKQIRIKHINNMWGLGTPEDLNYFLSNYKKDI